MKISGKKNCDYCRFSSAIACIMICLISCVGVISADEASSTDATRTITDMMGNTVEIPTSVERVADYWNAHNEVVLMLGAGDKIVATTSIVHKMPYFNKVYPQIGTLSVPFDSTTKEVNIEETLTLKPDIAILSDGMNKSAEKLTGAGIPTVILYFTNFDDLKKCFLLTGDILGGDAKAKAEKYNSYLDSKISDITDVTSKIPAEKRLNVLHVNSLSPLQADGSKTLIDTWINVAGGINAAANDISGNQKPVTIEQIQSWNPDVIILMGTEKDKDTVLNDPQWKDLKAVKDGRLYLNPKGVFYWDRYGAEEALQIQWAARTLYPDLFPDLDIKDILKKFYSEFFDYSLTDDDIKGILNPQA